MEELVGTDKLYLMRQYELYVDLMDRVSARRHSTNTFFLSINTFLFTALGVLSTLGLEKLQLGWAFLVSAAGLTLCYCWYRLIKSYKGLNTGKFEIIHKLEEKLPAQLFKDEWEALGEGKNPDKYLPFSEIEMWVPWVFFALYAVLLLWSVLETVIP